MSFIIFIFLCAVFSAKGQEINGYDPLERALQWEREVYGSGDPSSVHSALRSKAACYEEASCFEEALRTLDRIRLYLLSPEEQSEVLLSKARYCINTGDSGAALGYLEESGRAGDYPDIYSVLLASSWRFSESREKALEFAGEDEIRREAVVNIFKKAPRPRKEGTATFLSFFPPAGQIYLGEPLRGIGSMIMNAGAAGFTVVELVNGNWITGILGGGVLLNETFFKANLQHNLSRVEVVNGDSVKEFADSLRELLESFGKQD